MATEYNPRIVTDNLVFYVDAGNTKSYPGTGDTWTDMSGVNNGTLTNSPTFSSDNGGYFDFDGADEYVDLGSIGSSNALLLDDPAGGGLTISTAFNWTLGDSFPRIIDKSDGSSGQNGWSFFINKNASMNNGRLRFSEDSVSMTSDTYSEPATWQIWTFTHVKADGAWVWYMNGMSDNSGTTTYSIPADEIDAQIGRAWANGSKRYKGKIPFVMVYNRALSAAEVKQNFDALKGRYDL